MPIPTCIVTGTLNKLDGTVATGAPVTFRLANETTPFKAAGSLIAQGSQTVTTDGSGFFQITLIRSSALAALTGAASGLYLVTAPAANLAGRFLAPDLSTVDLSTLSFT